MTKDDDVLESSVVKRPLVYVLNPYVPAYRVSFFSGLARELNSKSMDLKLITGRTPKAFRQRKDFSALPSIQIVRRSLSIKLLGAQFKYLFCANLIKNANVVVYEYSIANLNTWRALLFRRGHKAVIWGHGPGYLNKEHKLRLWMQAVMARRADLVLTYTDAGRDKVIAFGVSPKNVVSVQNTIDTKEISEAVERVLDSEVTQFMRQHSISGNDKVLAFIGALDKTKRIDFLTKALDEVWLLDKTIKLIVGGAGAQIGLLNESISRGQTIYLGRVGPKDKALISKIALALVNPGNTGLLAVDALIMKLPILGTGSPSSPEKDYLKEDETFLTFTNDPKRFAQQTIDFTESEKTPKISRQIPQLENFIQRFSDSISAQIEGTATKKLLIVTNLPAPYRLSLFEELATRFELTVAYTGWRDEGRMWGDEDSRSKTYESLKGGWLLGRGKIRIPFANTALKNSIRKSDIIMTGGWHTPAYVRTLKNAKNNGKSSILWFESTLDSARFRSGPIALIRTRIFLLADAIFVPGKAAALAAEEYSKGQLPIVQLSNPIQSMFLEDAHTETSSVQGSTGTKFLYFGRLLKLKRVDLLIDAFCITASPEDTLTIVGDGPMKDSLVSQASESRLSGQIVFEPAVRDSSAIGIYRQHQVLVLPSNLEVWGMVIPEALVLGLRVVASDTAGAAASFTQFPTFSLFKSESTSDLAEKLTRAKQITTLNATQRANLIALNSPKEFAIKMEEEVQKIEKKRDPKSSGKTK